MKTLIRLVRERESPPMAYGHEYYSIYVSGEKVRPPNRRANYNSPQSIKNNLQKAYPDATIKTGVIIYKEWITRADLRSNPVARYVFGDNSARVGFGGQDREMRGEPNAIGVPTMRSPGTLEKEYFSDSVERDRESLLMGLDEVLVALEDWRTVFVPSKGIGTGHSELSTRAPHLYAELRYFFNRVSEGTCPWG